MACIRLLKKVYLVRKPEELEILGCEDHLERARQAADKGITLVKNTYDELPIRPETHKRIRLYMIEGGGGGIYDATSKGELFIKEELEKRGFEVTINDR